MPHRQFIPVFAGLTIAVAMSALLVTPVMEHSRRASPDGAFVAVARTQPLYSMIPVMPGQGSDKPGRVTVYRGEENCGSAWVEMVSFFYDLQWRLDVRPREAAIRLAATWNLDNCTVKILQR